MRGNHLAPVLSRILRFAPRSWCEKRRSFRIINSSCKGLPSEGRAQMYTFLPALKPFQRSIAAGRTDTRHEEEERTSRDIDPWLSNLNSSQGAKFLTSSQFETLIILIYCWIVGGVGGSGVNAPAPISAETAQDI